MASAAAVSSPGLADAAAAQDAGDPLEGRYLEPVFDEMTVTEGHIYGEAVYSDGVQRELELDVYEPAGDTAGVRPVIVLLHGGFFVMGSHKDEAYGGGPGVAQAFTDMGYVVASVQYRLRPELPMIPPLLASEDLLAQFEAAALDAHDDVAAAIDWLRDHAADLRIDTEAIVPHGVSAGGVIAWNMAWLPGSGARPDAAGVPAAVSVAGAPYETSTITGEPLAAASPGDAPVLAYNGTVDPIMDYDELVVPPCDRAAAAGVRCELVTFEGLGHPAVGGGDPFTDRFWASLDITTAFLAEEVLIPLGYVDAVPAPEDPGSTPSTTPPPPDDATPPSSPGGEPPATTRPVTTRPVARPARPVIAEPTYTG